MFLQLLIAMLATWINRHQKHAIVSLREENHLLKAQRKGRRMQLTETERRRLAVLAYPIDDNRLQEVSSMATPDTLKRWYRRLVVQAPRHKRHRTQQGRPQVAEAIERLVVRMANEHSRWGSCRLQGTLSNVGYQIDKMPVRTILRRNHIAPAPIRGRGGMGWSQCIELHLEVLQETGFFAVQISTLAHLWTMVTKLVRTLDARCARLVGFIRRGAISMLALLAQQCDALWAGCFPDLDTRCHRAFGRRRRVSDGPFPSMRLVSSPPVSLRLQGNPMEQERRPPGARHLGCTVSTRRHCWERGVSNTCRVSMQVEKAIT